MNRNKTMYMTLRQLTLFKAVAQHLSFTRAAAELCLTQPAVSIQIKQLEGHIGMPLFEQIGKRIFLTDAGRALYTTCVDIFARLEILEASLDDLQDSIKGLLKISAVTTTSYFLPHLINAFVSTHPEVQVRLNTTNRTAVLERLVGNEDDLVIMGRVPEQLNVESSQFLDNPLVVVAPPHHPLVGETGIPLSRLAEENILLREVGSGVRLAVEKVFVEHDLELKSNIELCGGEAIKQGVIAGLGVSVLAKHTLMLELATGAVKILDVEGFPQIKHWFIAHLTEKKLSLVARTFLEFLLTNAEGVMEKIQQNLPHVD